MSVKLVTGMMVIFVRAFGIVKKFQKTPGESVFQALKDLAELLTTFWA